MHEASTSAPSVRRNLLMNLAAPGMDMDTAWAAPLILTISLSGRMNIHRATVDLALLLLPQKSKNSSKPLSIKVTKPLANR